MQPLLSVAKRIVLALCLWLSVFATTADAQTFNFASTAPIDLPELSAAAPDYPSTILVSGVPTNISEIFVTIDGLTHPFIADLNFVLEGPGGGNVALMIGAGSQSAGTAANNAVMVFRDSAATSIPSDAQLVSGSYRPTNNDPGYSLLAPAPQGPYGNSLSLLQNETLNGEWKLFVTNAGGDPGLIANGWQIGFNTMVLPEPSSLGLFSIVLGSVFIVRMRRVPKLRRF